MIICTCVSLSRLTPVYKEHKNILRRQHLQYYHLTIIRHKKSSLFRVKAQKKYGSLVGISLFSFFFYRKEGFSGEKPKCPKQKLINFNITHVSSRKIPNFGNFPIFYGFFCQKIVTVFLLVFFHMIFLILEKKA